MRLLHVLAVMSLAGLTACGPPGPRDLHKGERLVNEGQYSEAIPVLTEAVQLLRTSTSTVQATAWNLLGMAFQGAGQTESASKAYVEALKLDRNLWAADYNMGCLRMEQSNFQGAVDYLTTYTTSHTTDVSGFLLLGRARLKLAQDRSAFVDKARQLDNARMDYEYAERLRSTAEACNALGLIELLRHTPTAESVKSALADFQLALQRTPNYPPALLNMAIVEHRFMNAPKDALATYKQYMALQPPPADVKDVERVARQLDLDMRITITPRMVERPGAPPQPPLSNNAVARQTPPPAEPTATRPAPRPPQKLAVAETRPETREVTESPPIQTTTTFPVTTTTAPPVTPTTRENAQSAPDEVPATTQTEEHKSSFMHKLNPLNWFSGKSRKSDESPKPTPVDIANIERYSYPLSVTPIPGDRQRAQQLTAEGRQAERQSNRSQAMQYYREAMKADPTYFDPTVALGLAALDAKDYNTALDALGQALTIQGNSVDARYAFAWVLGKKGYYQDAANELDRLLAGHPREVRAHLLLGNLYADNLGQPKLAREQYLKALELVDPQSSQAAVIRSWLEENP